MQRRLLILVLGLVTIAGCATFDALAARQAGRDCHHVSIPPNVQARVIAPSLGGRVVSVAPELPASVMAAGGPAYPVGSGQYVFNIK